jgi:hypothetical protein
VDSTDSSMYREFAQRYRKAVLKVSYSVELSCFELYLIRVEGVHDEEGF